MCYDQLNRIKEVNNYKGYNSQDNSWQATNEHKEALSFDPNGNIQTALLNGNAAQLGYENFTYSYDPVKPNRLLSITNTVNNTTSNYQYDAIGNVTKDELEGNSQMQWNVYGKLTHVVKANGTVIDYSYDAAGNRISKKVGSKLTVYVRDASGNVMVSYLKDASINSGNISTEGFYIYGSSMLGRWKQVVNVQGYTVAPDTIRFARGEKEYYFSNHLGNNLLVLSDKKLQHSSDNTVVDWYNADVVSATDYSAYGENLVGREFNGGSIKYGFNGKENDTDVGYQDYGFRMYNPRTRRFLSVDPLTKDYPWYTPYQYAGNTSIQAIDLDGAEEYHYKLTLDKQGKTHLQTKITKLYNEHNWLGGLIYFKTKINVERALVEYEGKKYYIGFQGSYGRGNENGMAAFNEFKKNPIAPLFPLMFLNEEQSYSSEEFSMAVQFQTNTAMYGPLTRKAWYSHINEPGSRKRLESFLKYSPKWNKGSISEVLKNYAPGVDGILSGDGVKTKYLNTKTNIEVMVDNENNYFRIFDRNKNQYIGLDGKVPSTQGLNGTEARDHVQSQTHFVNTDK